MKIFVSHAVVDFQLASDLVDPLRLGAGVQHTDIFCSSIKGSIPNGSSFVDEILRKLSEAELVIALLSRAYLRSDFCKAEAGAAQVKKVAGQSQIHALLVPPVDFPDLAGVLYGMQGGKIHVPASLNELRDRVIAGNPRHPGTDEWNGRLTDFLGRAKDFVELQVANDLTNRVCCTDSEFVRDIGPNTTYKLKLNVSFRNDTGSTIEAFKPSWETAAGQQPTIDGWSGLLKQQLNGSWGAHRGQVTVNNGQTFIASVAFNPALADADLRRKHETLNLGTLVLPLKINGHEVELRKKL